MTDTSLKITEDMRPVRWGFDEMGPFDGYTDGSTWNGWLNVEVTPDVHAQVCEQMRRDMALIGDDSEETNVFFAMQPGPNGLVDYGNCYCATEWDDGPGTPYQRWVASGTKVDDLGERFDDISGPGMLYGDGAWIAADRDESQRFARWQFSTIVGNQEYASEHLGSVQWWLWRNWSCASGRDRFDRYVDAQPHYCVGARVYAVVDHTDAVPPIITGNVVTSDRKTTRVRTGIGPLRTVATRYVFVTRLAAARQVRALILRKFENAVGDDRKLLVARDFWFWDAHIRELERLVDMERARERDRAAHYAGGDA